MEREQVRLECLKLLHRFDRTPAQVILDAAAYEDYVVGSSDEVKEAPKKPSKKSGNPDILS